MSDKYDEMARELATTWFHNRGFPCDERDLPALEQTIAAALRQAATVPPGHVREGDVDMRAPDGVPVTKDGVVVVPMVSVVYHPKHPEMCMDVDVSAEDVIGQIGITQPDRSTVWWTYPISECYGSPAAAEAASKRAGEAQTPP